MNATLVPAIFLFYGILSLAYAGVLIQFLSRRKDRVIAFWSSGALCVGIATIATIFRDPSNLIATYVGANGLAFIGYLLFNYALKEFLAIGASTKRILLVATAAFFAYCFSLYFVGIFFESKYQTIFISTLVVMTSAYAGVLGYRIYKKSKINHAAILSATSFLNSFIWALRILLAASDISINAFNPSVFNSIIFVCIFLLGMFWYFNFIGLLYSQSNEAEQEALSRFEGMAKTLPCALYEYYLYPDYTSEFRYFSPSIKEIVGHSARAIMKNASLIIDRVHPEDKEYFWKVNLEAYNSGKTFFIETRMIIWDGTIKWVQLSSSPRGEDFKNVSWSGYIIDITERKTLEAAALRVDSITKENEAITLLLKEKERLVTSLLKANKTATTGALSASIAHELNQPIGASNINIQFLQKKLDNNEFSPELGKQILALLARDNDRAGNIIRSLRSIFLETGEDDDFWEFNDALDSILEIIRPECRKINITLSIQKSGNLNLVASEVEIKQVLLNLLNNAIRELGDVHHSRKEILIECAVEGNLAMIAISDSGRGVPLELQDNLFELLSSEKNIGMGLGLWLCKHIITRHGGKLHYGQSDMGGAKFLIAIPILPNE